MLDTVKLLLTDHAVQRWSERSGLHRDELRKTFRSCEPATKKMLKRIRDTCPAHRKQTRRNLFETKFIYWIRGNHVFVTKVEGVGVYTLVTYWKMEGEVSK